MLLKVPQPNPSSEENRPVPSSQYADIADLVAAIKRQELDALGYLFDQYSSLVYTLAYKILGNSSEAEDLMQEIFLGLWERCTYNPSRGSLSSFLATVTRSRAIDRLRMKGNRRRILSQWQDSLSPNPSPTPLDHASQSEKRQALQQALTELPEEYRQVLELSYFGGYSQSQIAEQLDKPLGTVKTWARKGLIQLRQSLRTQMEL
ncbi:sigma-70 family RNA polymerase sigma factor [Acaryochloris sp. CCMEE 5410]|uniref:sigma-70 family RNA polymerase sigma factor n=1 Tax=Acaryochloris sp. CCMEE 5410 TaxID=310037 RepID=UPI0002485244|nr:sigma-70 family RNA polymerase sigma factor [Acaryochloris sp. CCMEE 5410]KAI9130723.1 sigma-70 family RNA polymerase sigma factor [Acaryochloris sp. CCMEE 5410]